MTKINNLNLFAVKSSPMMAEWEEKELERLGLYEVFLKLYEHHRSLLDEILQLENLYQPSFKGVKPRYIQGVVDTSAVYVVTNLCDDETQSLLQPEQIWTIGRDRTSGIHIADSYLSRRHAGIQYLQQQGFYLVDFNSTNGSFVNGEPVYQPVLLKDGDRIRLGNMTFHFFINHAYRTLPNVAVELLMQLVPKKVSDEIQTLAYPLNTQKNLAAKLDNSVHITKDIGLTLNLGEPIHSLSAEQQSDILDRFFNRQISDK